MKYYLVESHFQKPFESFGEIVPQHRAWLQQWYDKGVLLCSGPKSDKSGGVIIGRAEESATLQALIDGDPYQRNGLAQYTLTEFDAAKRASVLDAW
jgi:uncharacterized protein YciI